MKAPDIMRRRVSYEDNRRSVSRVFAGKNKLLTKCFRNTSEYYVDVIKVQLTFSQIQ